MQERISFVLQAREQTNLSFAATISEWSASIEEDSTTMKLQILAAAALALLAAVPAAVSEVSRDSHLVCHWHMSYSVYALVM